MSDASSPSPSPPPSPVKAVLKSKSRQKEDAKFVRERRCHHILLAGLAISERRCTNRAKLHDDVLKDFQERVSKDPDASSKQKEEMLEGHGNKPLQGNRIWTRFKEIKSTIKNTYQRLYENPKDHSGWNQDTAFECTRKKIWVESIKATPGVAIVARKMDDCPANFEPVEFYTFKKNFDHPKLSGKAAESRIGDDVNNPDMSLRAQVISRKKQRQDENHRAKKQKKDATSQKNSNGNLAVHPVSCSSPQCVELLQTQSVN
jgi:hypothetical protein